MNLDEAIDQMKAIYDYMGGITNVNGQDVHPPSILAAMMNARTRLAAAEKVVEAAQFMEDARKANRDNVGWISLHNALAQHEASKGATNET